MSKSAFISYSWDSDAHRGWVRDLAARLRADGVDVSIDRWAAVPGDQLPRFMEEAIRDNSFVIIICTPRYKQRSDSREGGVGYEGDIMTAEILQKGNRRKFIPVLRHGDRRDALPTWLQGSYVIDLAGNRYSEREYEDLVRTLLDIRETAPPIGKPMSTIASASETQNKAQQGNNSGAIDDIRITRVIIEEITSPRKDGTAGSALYSIPFALSRRPPTEWAALFKSNWDHPPQWTTMHRPGIARVQGATIVFDGTTIDEVEHSHRDTLQLAVAETNRQYREWKQKEDAREVRERAEREEHLRHVQDVTKRIKFD
jgi:hypothetical protein